VSGSGAARPTPNDRLSSGWRRPFLWVFTLGSLVVALGVLWQAFTIVAYVRGAGDQARDLHVLGAYVVHTVEIVVFLAALVAFWGNWLRVAIALLFPVVGTIQVFAIGDTDAQGGWVTGLHGLLALVMLLWAAWFGRIGARALFRA
jgi:hypothetical protein